MIAGVDEAGRGPLAGPVVAACVITTSDLDFNSAELAGIRDSKKLSPEKREILYEKIFIYIADHDISSGKTRIWGN